jgi:hypothetical protein
MNFFRTNQALELDDFRAKLRGHLFELAYKEACKKPLPTIKDFVGFFKAFGKIYLSEQDKKNENVDGLSEEKYKEILNNRFKDWAEDEKGEFSNFFSWLYAQLKFKKEIFFSDAYDLCYDLDLLQKTKAVFINEQCRIKLPQTFIDLLKKDNIKANNYHTVEELPSKKLPIKGALDLAQKLGLDGLKNFFVKIITDEINATDIEERGVKDRKENDRIEVAKQINKAIQDLVVKAQEQKQSGLSGALNLLKAKLLSLAISLSPKKV